MFPNQPRLMKTVVEDREDVLREGRTIIGAMLTVVGSGWAFVHLMSCKCTCFKKTAA
jgi:hypothetical protein